MGVGVRAGESEQGGSERRVRARGRCSVLYGISSKLVPE